MIQLGVLEGSAAQGLHQLLLPYSLLRSPKWQGNIASSHHILATLCCFHSSKSPVSVLGKFLSVSSRKQRNFYPGLLNIPNFRVPHGGKEGGNELKAYFYDLVFKSCICLPAGFPIQNTVVTSYLIRSNLLSVFKLKD